MNLGLESTTFVLKKFIFKTNLCVSCTETGGTLYPVLEDEDSEGKKSIVWFINIGRVNFIDDMFPGMDCKYFNYYVIDFTVLCG